MGFSSTKCHFEVLSITENILLIDTQRYTWYIDALILNLQYQYTHWNIMDYSINIVPSLIHRSSQNVVIEKSSLTGLNGVGVTLGINTQPKLYPVLVYWMF